MEQLPDELAALAEYPQFILYKLVWDATKQKYNKIPISPHTYQPYPKGSDWQNTPRHTTDANSAIKAAALMGDEYGVGFLFTKNDPLFFLDIDNCRVPGEPSWSPLAMEIMARLPGAAVEVSQSGKGLHIFGQGTPPPHSNKNIALGLELYTHSRFVALTGTNVVGSAATDCSQLLPAVVETYFTPKGTTKTQDWTTEPVAGWDGITDDAELINKALASQSAAGIFNGKSTFASLWNNEEDVLARSYPDPEGPRAYDSSSADAALAQHLSFWTGNNCERILRLMSLSGLKRDKWERKDYLERTILKAASMQTTFHGMKVNCVNSDCPDIGLEKCFQPLESLRAHSLSKLTADHFVDARTILNNTFDNRLVNLNGIPYYFNGKMFERASDRLLRRCIGSAMGRGDIKVTQNRIAGTLSVIKDQAPEIGGPDPANRNIFFNDCVLNTDTGESSHHKIENRNTSTLSVKYDRDAGCPKFSEFLHTIFSDDIGQIQLLQELMGWILCRDNLGIEKAALFIGPPRAGKGVLARLIFALLGSGAVPFRLSDLDDNKRLSGMRQAKVAIDTDAVGASSRNARAVIGLFKIITSNETLSIPQLYTQTPWEGALNCKLFVLANSIPTMWDDSAATANRWVPVVFSKSFLGKENPNLYKQLSPELPGISVWAFEGLRRLIARGYFKLPPNSQDQLDSLITEGGSTQDFINECLVLGKNQRTSESALWDTYHCWAVRSGRETKKRQYLLKSLEDALRSNGVRRVKSIKLSDGKFHRGFYGVDVKPEATSKNIISFPPKY